MAVVKIKVPENKIKLINELSKSHDIDEEFIKWLSKHKEDKELQKHSLRKFVRETKDEDDVWEYYR